MESKPLIVFPSVGDPTYNHIYINMFIALFVPVQKYQPPSPE